MVEESSAASDSGSTYFAILQQFCYPKFLIFTLVALMKFSTQHEKHPPFCAAWASSIQFEDDYNYSVLIVVSMEYILVLGILSNIQQLMHWQFFWFLFF